MEPRYGMIYRRRFEVVRPERHLKLKSNLIGLYIFISSIKFYIASIHLFKNVKEYEVYYICSIYFRL